MVDALCAGMGISEFWESTPREVSIFFEAMARKLEREQENIISHAWLTAKLQRVKKIPNLDNFIKKRAQTEEEMLRSMQNIFRG